MDGSVSLAESRRLGLGGSSSRHDAEHFVEGGGTEALFIERGFAREEFVDQHAQRVDVAASIGAQRAHLRLLGAHVFQRADHRAVLR